MTDIARLLDIMARLRDPAVGCPWDVEQTFSSIAPYTIEEAYEVADAIDRHDLAGLKDELGDLLLQVVFHARMAEEAGAFAFGDVVDAICAKMVRRHPHVFRADGSPADAVERIDAGTQTRRWEDAKRQERGAADVSALDGVSSGLPEWMRAEKLQKRAARVGFDWPHVDHVLHKLHEELDEVRREFAQSPRNQERLTDEIGDVLFVCVNLARHAQVDFGAALRHANRKFERRFRAMETMARADGAGLESLALDAQDRYWDLAKAAERGTE